MAEDKERNRAANPPTSGTPPAAINSTNIDYSHAQRARFYANHVVAQVTLFDVRLVLSSVHIEGSKLIADEAVDLLLSPELAVVLQNVLAQSIQTYSGAYGGIRSAPGRTGEPTAEQ
jgi:hypothetical protein